MNIKILGTGCARCREMEKAVKEVVSEMKVEAGIEHVTDMNKILEYPILTTPGLVINEKLVVAGKVPNKKDLAKLISDATANKTA